MPLIKKVNLFKLEPTGVFVKINRLFKINYYLFCYEKNGTKLHMTVRIFISNKTRIF